MKLKILNFGIAREITGERELIFEVKNDISVADFCIEFTKQFPQLNEVISFSVAVNQEYALPGQILSASDEIAIIPPVSGG